MVDRVIEKNINRPGSVKNVYLPALGCGCGNLNWEVVRKEIELILPDLFVVVLK